MAYIKTAERDAVLAIQIASPGRQVTIGFIAAVLEEAELKASERGITLRDADAGEQEEPPQTQAADQPAGAASSSSAGSTTGHLIKPGEHWIS